MNETAHFLYISDFSAIYIIRKMTYRKAFLED